jgi:hypothetical protein
MAGAIWVLVPALDTPSTVIPWLDRCFSQFSDQLSMRPPRSPGIWPRIEPRGGLERFVAQELPHHLIGTRIRIQMDFRGQMPELVRRDLQPNTPQYRPLDRDTQCGQLSWFPFGRHEQNIGTVTDD